MEQVYGCQAAMKEIMYLKAPNDPGENHRMLRKLPRNLAERWTREVDRWVSKEKQNSSGASRRSTHEVAYPPFSVFYEFVKKESRIACNPATLLRAKEEVEKKEEPQRKIRFSGNNKNRSPRAGAFASGTEEIKGGFNDK